jgi:putative colanic acid biosynthesis glycosyltransferase WcaI
MPSPPDNDTRPRLLVLNYYYGPAESSSGQLLTEMCEDMVGEVDVTVVAANPDDEETLSLPSRGVDIRWTPVTPFGKTSLVLRLLNYLSFLLAAGPMVLRAPRPDVVLCMTNPPVVGMLGALLAGIRGARLIVIVQDVHPEVGVISGRLTNKLGVWALRWARRFFFRRAERIIAISEAMKQRLVERGAEAERVVVINNWIDADEITPRPRDNEWAQEHGLDDGFTVMHAGNVGLLQAIEAFVDAAELVPEARFVILGEGANKKALEERARSKSLPNVVFVPRQPQKELSDVLASTDAHLVSLMPGLAGLMEPSKLYGALATGRPVLAAMELGTEAAEVVERTGCGVVVAPAQPEALAAGVRELAALQQSELQQMGEKARAYCEQFCNRRRSTDAYRELVTSLT